MSLLRVVRLVALTIVVCGLVGAGASSAGAVSPWWHLTSGTRPGSLEVEGKGQIVVTASNLGDAETTGEVRIADKLPQGLKAVGIAGNVVDNGPIDELPPLSCSTVTLTCTATETVLPYSKIEVRIKVEVQSAPAAGEVNEVSIIGGGAPGASFKRPVVISGEPTPFGVEGDELTPENVGGTVDTQAGSHPFQLTSTFAFNQNASGEPIALGKDLHFRLPPGLVGNPTPFPQCTIGQFLKLIPALVRDECSPQDAIGVAVVTVNAAVLGGPTSIVEPLFNLEPAVGEPARFGFYVVVFGANAPVILDTAVRTGGDYGVTVNVNNITQIAGFISSQVTFWGVPRDPSHNPQRGWSCIDGTRHEGNYQCEILPEERHPLALLSLPTSCTGPLQSSVEADSWVEEGVFTAPFAVRAMPSLDGCNRLPFTPSIQVTPDGLAGSTPTGLTVGVHVPQDVSLDAGGLSEADVRNTTVTLPAGVALNAAAADGLLACSEAQVALEVHSVPTCPEASKVATVQIKSPLLPNPLEGEMYLAAQNANPFGSLVALYLVAQDPVSSVLIKVAGEVALDPVTGQLVATFKNTPQLPFEDLKIHFFGGDRAPLGSPASCSSYTTSSSVVPWSGNAAAEPSSEFKIVSGPNGSACSTPLPFVPSLTAGTTSIQAGGFSPFTMTMSREDGSQNLQGIQLHMPPGLSGTLANVKLCGEEQADAGTCGAESLIGETTVSVGLGGDPFSVTGGKVYMTGPYKGAPFGLSIVNPAKAGPYDLGKVVVRAKIDVNPETAALTITTDNEGPYKIPTIIDGIPLEIKHVNVDINRPGFTFNPTNCSPLAITGSLVSTEGATDALSVPFQVTNCAVLAFKPQLTASTSGKTSRANGASFTVKLGYPAGPYDANISRVKVELPKALPSRLTTLQKACAAVVFDSNPAGCPPASIVGHATATTPEIPVPLSGPAYFVSHGGEAFPSLVIVLQGYGVTIHLVGSTFINKAGITSSTFKTVPDAPVGTFELTLPQGQFSALAANGNLCKEKLVMPTEFVGQNGALIKTSTKIAVTGCPKARHKAKKASKRHRGKRGAKGKGRKKK